MNPDAARGSLDEIRRLQDRTRDAYVRHGFSRPALLVTALGVFVTLASLDLPPPWRLAVALAGEGVLLGAAFVHCRRAPVRWRPTLPVAAFYAGAVIVLVGTYVAYSVAASLAVLAFGWPVQHTLSAAALALTIPALAGPARRALASIVRHD